MGQPSVGTETGAPGVGGPLWVSAKLLPVDPVAGTVSVMVLLPVPLRWLKPFDGQALFSGVLVLLRLCIILQNNFYQKE